MVASSKYKILHTTLLLNLIILVSLNTISSSRFPSAKNSKQLGIALQDFITIASHSKIKSPDRTIDLKIFWTPLLPTISEEIRQNCGAQLFLNGLLSNKNPSEFNFKPKAVNCSFTNEYALVKIIIPDSVKLSINNGKIVVLSIHSFKGDQEVCSLKLRGYEKFHTIFITYSLDKDKLALGESFALVKFPQGFDRLVTVETNDIRSLKNNIILLDPNEGKGKSFRHTKNCIRTLISDKSVDDIDNKCIFECNDFDEDLGGVPVGMSRVEL